MIATRKNWKGGLSALAPLMMAGLIATSTTNAHAKDVLHKGEPMQFGKGTAHSWVVTDLEERPLAVGVSISERAMSSVSGTHSIDLSVPLPRKGVGLVFDHVYLNWNEHGHPPAELFGAPHFDVHFYLVDTAAREAISPVDPDFMKKGSNYPPQEFVPAGYAPPPAPDPVPQMGFHYTDLTVDIFQGEPFTQVFIYGGWDGEITFLEPMITLDTFQKQETLVLPIKQPARYPKPGHYPTQYRIAYDEVLQEHRVVLEDFVWRD